MIIDLGCGRHKVEGAFGIDCQALPGVDLVCNCNERIPLDDGIADFIHANDFLEHINNDKRIHIMTEIWRILKPGGMFKSFTPSTDGRGAFQDPTHYSFWNENSFIYYSDYWHRILYNIQAHFEILHISTDITNAEKNICHVNCLMKAIK